MVGLRSPYLRGIARVDDVADGGNPLMPGETSIGVAQVQAALRDMGYALPGSTRGGAIMDGYFGPETAAAIKQFQTDQRIGLNTAVGAQSLLALDRALLTRLSAPLPRPGRVSRRSSRDGRRSSRRSNNPPPIGAPDPYPLPFEDRYYQIGTNDPYYAPDAGAGGWKSKPWTYSAVARKEAIIAAIGGPMLNGPAAAWPGPNAARHLWHYFENTGLPLAINLEGMVRDVPSAKQMFIAEFRNAQAFVQSPPIGRYDIVSRYVQNDYDTEEENADWYFATGGYIYWGKGRAEVTKLHNQLRYDIDFHYHFYDRYNWDGGKQVTIAGIVITDEFMGEFHREGLAKEYDCYGQIRRRLTWTDKFPVPSDEQILARQGR